MNGFKLIAIRPLKDCDKKLLKVLTEGQIYQFYSDYKFIREDETNIHSDIKSIEYNSTVPDLLYNIGDISINISAIVGKNGSGKSSLIELFFATIYNISIEKEILQKIVNDEDIIQNLVAIDNLFVEIFYEIDENIFCLKTESTSGSKFKIFKFKDNKTSRKLKIFKIIEDDFKYIQDFFFYTIAINYSLYGLNSNLMGIWIKSLFYKNDGYQAPVVINPFRESGNIDINRESYLAKQRLLSNILKPNEKSTNDNYRYLTDNQKVESIAFSLNKSKIEYAFSKGRNNDIVTFVDFFNTDNKDSILEEVYNQFFLNKRPGENVKFRAEVELYIIKKLIKIARTYSEYKDFFHDDLIVHVGEQGSTINESETLSSHFEKLSEYLSLLKEDRSHITFKLRQALNYLMNNILQDDIENNFHWETKTDDDDNNYELLTVTVDNLSNKIAIAQNEENELIELIPPSLFDIELNLITKDDSLSRFSELSSGEQQLIHTIQSIIYNAININSVFNGPKTEKKIVYKAINIILDEVELYFHPEFQRIFIQQLVSSIHRINLSNIKKFNILFSTHSPFILSDIPSANILKIKEGKQVHDTIKTFGANIHNLLANEFFMKDGFMGALANQKITELITEINMIDKKTISQIDEDNYYKRINMIGEPFIKEKLSEMLSEKISSSTYLAIEKKRKE